jgi:hypothetical protein
MKKADKYWKILTNDFRPPLQGGNALCDGKTWPVKLPKVHLDRSDSECGIKGGWHFCRTIEAGLLIAGLWRTGRPSSIVLVEPHGDIIERGDKLRAETLTLLRVASDDEIRAALMAFSKPFGKYQKVMSEEQWLWRQALGRPVRNRDAVYEGVTVALRARSLDWKIKEYPTERDAWDAWAVWAAWDARAARAAWAARDAWDAWAARAARDAWAAWSARDSWAPWDAWDAWDAWAARDARDAWAAWDAWAALMVQFSARSGWIIHPFECLTVGIRDAYLNGLQIAIPTSKHELGIVIAKDTGTLEPGVAA